MLKDKKHILLVSWSWLSRIFLQLINHYRSLYTKKKT